MSSVLGVPWDHNKERLQVLGLGVGEHVFLGDNRGKVLGEQRARLLALDARDRVLVLRVLRHPALDQRVDLLALVAERRDAVGDRQVCPVLHGIPLKVADQVLWRRYTPSKMRRPYCRRRSATTAPAPGRCRPGP